MGAAWSPGDVYVPHYYTNDWQPQYLTRGDLYQRVVNLNVPGAVTVVSIDDFTRGGFDWRRARKADRNMLAQVNPVLDPLLVTPLRNAVVNSAGVVERLTFLRESPGSSTILRW